VESGAVLMESTLEEDQTDKQGPHRGKGVTKRKALMLPSFYSKHQ